MHHPADCSGDSGAACGPIMAGLAALGIRDSYRRTPALVYGSSDRGARAADDGHGLTAGDSMGQTTFANFRGIAHKQSGGMSTAFPRRVQDAGAARAARCRFRTRTSARLRTRPSGPTSVTADGAMPMVKGAEYMKSSGDEAGVAGGVASEREHE